MAKVQRARTHMHAKWVEAIGQHRHHHGCHDRLVLANLVEKDMLVVHSPVGPEHLYVIVGSRVSEFLDKIPTRICIVYTCISENLSMFSLLDFETS